MNTPPSETPWTPEHPMDAIRRQCTARSKRSGERCKRLAAVGASVCSAHGGKSLRGPAHPSYKHGRHSRILPARMREDYERAITDEELMSLRAEIAVIDARITDLLSRADSGESGRLWRQLSAQMRAVNTAHDPDSVEREITALQQLIDAGAADGALWDEIREALLTRERLVRSERKRLVEARLVISVEQAQLLMTMFVDAAKEAVGHDEEAMRRIVEAFVRLTGYDPARQRIDADGGVP